ncbi:MAG: DUF1559 domain-containing protein [Pirellulales bacterium]
MRRHGFAVAFLAANVVAVLLHGSPSGAADAALVDSLARLMGEEAIAVARVDLERVDAATLASVLKFLPDLARGIRSPDDALGIAQQVRAAAGNEVYFLISVPNLNELPVVCVVPLEDAARAQTAGEAFRLGKTLDDTWRHQVVDQMLVAGPKGRVDAALESLEAARQATDIVASRPHLAAALDAVADRPLAVAFVPSADQQRVLDELTPELPAELGADTLRNLVRDVRWSSAAYEPRQSLRVTLAADSEASAATVLEHLDGVLGALMLQSRLTGANSAEAPLMKVLGPVLEKVEPRQVGNVVELEVAAEHLAALVPPPADGLLGRRAAMQQLRQVAVAMHGYANIAKSFPDAASRDGEGKPLLSWRVQVLPFVEGGEALYKEFHLDEPWDSEHNKKLIERMPDVYKLPGSKAAAGKTCVQLPIGDQTICPAGKGLRFRDIRDGTSNTILLVEADDEHAVTWTAPDDLKYDADKPSTGLGSHYGEGFLAVMGDGSVRFFEESVPVETLRALFSPNGREVIDRP